MLPEKQVLFPKKQGFSLLELIITLVVGGILVATIYTLTRTHPLNSVEPLLFLQKNSRLVQAMEEINGYYRWLIQENALTDLESFAQEIPARVKAIDSNLKVQTEFIDFNAEHKETSDTQNKKRFLKVSLSNDKITIFNLFTR
ncbi:MAG: hypothetical protein PWR24_103 [Desulfonauticus sp.]|jgi:prepilin-type N-terminal cleavage/methylation domain-containing protein|nr:hypothetical protein [Desulfonauticus sp.]